MKPSSSLRTRIFSVTAVLAVLSIATAVYLVGARVTRDAEEALQREIVATGTLVTQLQTGRAETLTLMARLIADAPRLKAAVDTNDPPTVQAQAKDYQEQLRSNLLLITGASGDVLATVGASPQEGQVLANQPAVRAAAMGRESLSLLPQPDGILQLVTVPIALGLDNPDVLGTLSVGFLLDNEFAAQLRETTGSDIAFGVDGRILAATLPASERAGLAPLLTAGPGSHDVTLDTGEYVALPLPLTDLQGDREAERLLGVEPRHGPTALILRSRTDHLRSLGAIRRQLAITAVLAVLLATLLSFAVSRTITRPLAAITDTMREVAATGDLTRKIALREAGRWDDEDARLLAMTFNSLTDSVTRFQREMSQRERLSSLGRLSTVIAHEIRNPLMIIKAALHTLRQPSVRAAAVMEAAADIDEEVVRLNRIVNEVLDFARPIEFEFGTTNLNDLCRESAVAAQATTGAPVALNLAPSVPALVTDAERLRIALVNLVVNAGHAVEARMAAAVRENGRKQAERDFPPVVLSTLVDGNHVAIVVVDEGIGIEASDIPRVFDPYFTTKRGGTGLGLPIAKNIIDGLGGTIMVTSTPGRGTEIRIDLPLVQTSTCS